MGRHNEKRDKVLAYLLKLGWHHHRSFGGWCFLALRDLSVEVLTVEQVQEGFSQFLKGNFDWRVRRPVYLVNGCRYTVELPREGDRLVPTAERQWVYISSARGDFSGHLDALCTA